MQLCNADDTVSSPLLLIDRTFLSREISHVHAYLAPCKRDYRQTSLRSNLGTAINLLRLRWCLTYFDAARDGVQDVECRKVP